MMKRRQILGKHSKGYGNNVFSFWVSDMNSLMASQIATMHQSVSQVFLACSKSTNDSIVSLET